MNKYLLTFIIIFFTLLGQIYSQNDTRESQNTLGDAQDLGDRFPGQANRTPNGRTGPIISLPDIPYINFSIRKPQSNNEVALSLQLLLLMTLLTLSPTIIILLTSFLRISITLDFVRRALTLQQSPPTNVLMGISLFITAFVMWPIFSNIYHNAYQPFTSGQIDLQELYLRIRAPMKQFMFQQIGKDTKALQLFITTGNHPQPKTLADISLDTLIPSYILHELTVAFRIGVLIYIPFIIIDMVVSSILMSMGMIMLPPVMISMPFKLILFVSVNGWELIAQQLINSIRNNMQGLL